MDGFPSCLSSEPFRVSLYVIPFSLVFLFHQPSIFFRIFYEILCTLPSFPVLVSSMPERATSFLTSLYTFFPGLCLPRLKPHEIYLSYVHAVRRKPLHNLGHFYVQKYTEDPVLSSDILQSFPDRENISMAYKT